MPLNLPLPPLPVPTWVVFCDAPDVWWLRPLRPGFRHCFVVMRHKRTYVTIDPLLGSIEVMTHPVKRDSDLIKILKDHGLTVVSVDITRDQYRGNIGVMCTCVTIVKRVLNLHAPLIQTPYALYRYLNKCHPGRRAAETRDPHQLFPRKVPARGPSALGRDDTHKNSPQHKKDQP